jgi:hypothetical protein
MRRSFTRGRNDFMADKFPFSPLNCKNCRDVETRKRRIQHKQQGYVPERNAFIKLNHISMGILFAPIG